MGSVKTLTATAAALAVTATLTPVTATSNATQIGSVPAATAAAKMRAGMPATMNGAWARTNLNTLHVRTITISIGYSESAFPHWRDASTWGWPVAPNNACNARNAALYRDGTGVKMSSTCTNLTGTWIDPYTGSRFNAASDIDIDHVVPRKNAYVSGARTWSTAKRTQFANDPLVLMSVWDRQNSAKGDRSPDQWKPSNTAVHCNYAERWVAIKKKYALSVTKAEKSTLTTMLAKCA